MEKLKISKTVYPDVQPTSFNEWAKMIWSEFKIELDKGKSGWEKNVYIPKKSIV